MRATLNEQGVLLRQLASQGAGEWVLTKRQRCASDGEDSEDESLEEQLEKLAPAVVAKTAEVRKMGDAELRQLWEEIGTLGKLRRNASIATMRRTLVAHIKAQ